MKLSQSKAYRYISSYLLVFFIPYLLLMSCLFFRMSDSVDDLIIKENKERFSIISTMLKDEMSYIEKSVLAMSYKDSQSCYKDIIPTSLEDREKQGDIIRMLKKIIYPEYAIEDIAILYEKLGDTIITPSGTMTIKTADRANNIPGSVFSDFDDDYRTQYEFLVDNSMKGKVLLFKYCIKANYGMSYQIVAKVNMHKIETLLNEFLNDANGNITISCNGVELLHASNGKLVPEKKNTTFSYQINQSIEIVADMNVADNKNLLYNNLKNVIPLSTVLLLFGIFVSYALSKANLRPLHSLQKKILVKEEENYILNDMIRRANPFVEKQLMYDLLMGKIMARGVMGDINDIRSDKLRELFDMDEWRVLLLELKDFNLNYEQACKFQTALEELAEKSNYSIFPMEMLNGDIVLIVGGNMGYLSLEALQDFINGIYETGALVGTVHFAIGIGNTVNNSNEICNSYQNAMEKLSNPAAEEEPKETETEKAVADSAVISEEMREKKERMLHYIQNNISNPSFCRASTAEAFSMTENQLTSFFKLVVGVSFRDYVFRYKIQCARDLLENTNESVSAIMQKIGYNDLPNFTRTFRKETGITPGKYREMHHADTTVPNPPCS